MNIAIITFSDFNTNFGSILQALALKSFLQSEGHKVTFIRYREFHSYKSGSLVGDIRSLLIKFYYFLHRSERKKRVQNFRTFIDLHLNHTRLFSSEDDLEQNLDTFDAYVCGSDQIWNIAGLGGFRTPYFLKFAPLGKLKIAYAPSMGDYLPTEDIRERMGELLKNFDAISTRERGSSLLLSNLLGKDIPTVVDPTLLLDKEQWFKTIGKAKTPKGEYGVCYFVQRHPLAEKIVKHFKDKYKIPIYNVSDNLIHIRGAKNDFITCAPNMFVNLIANAKFCVGASFHLAAFSTIFDKHCYIIKTKHNESRVSGLFSLVDRNDHISDGDFDKLPNLQGSIDFRQYDTMVEMSKMFLREVLDKEKDKTE